MAEIVRLFGHGFGGRPSERIMARLGMPAGHGAILRHLKRTSLPLVQRPSPRVVGIDEWAWTKGMRFGTVIVDLERHQVVDLLPDRAVSSVAKWFNDHPGAELISRDRAGIYADGARRGAPQARQVADRFHLLVNFRESIARELSGVGPPIRENTVHAEVRERHDHEEAAHENGVSLVRRADRKVLFAQIRALYDDGSTVQDIARQLGLGPRRVYRWVRRISPPERNVMEPKSDTPAGFGSYLERRWNEGTTNGRQLLAEIVERGYSGSYSHLARFLAARKTRDVTAAQFSGGVAQRAKDPETGRLISSLTAAALCVKPRGKMTGRQLANLAVLKSTSVVFCKMRRLSMRLQGMLRSGDSSKLDPWMLDAEASGIYAMRRYVRALRRDYDAVRNAVVETWNNGQVEGQVNRLKTLKRSMYGSAGPDLLRARMMPLMPR